MLTIPTQTAIAVLHDIASGNTLSSAHFPLLPEDLEKLLKQLSGKGIIRLLPEMEAGQLSSYTLCRSLYEISLLDVIEITGEPVHIDYPLPESTYSHHREAAIKMGVASHIVRQFFSEIRLTDW